MHAFPNTKGCMVEYYYQSFIGACEIGFASTSAQSQEIVVQPLDSGYSRLKEPMYRQERLACPMCKKCVSNVFERAKDSLEMHVR